MDTFIRFLAGLLPPEGSDPRKLHEYLKRLGLSTAAVAGVLSLLIIVIFGLVPRVFGEGFVSNPQLTDVAKKLDDKVSAVASNQAATTTQLNHWHSTELEGRISDACDKYRKASGDELQGLYRANIQSMQNEYFQLNGANYPTPGCGSP